MFVVILGGFPVLSLCLTFLLQLLHTESKFCNTWIMSVTSSSRLAKLTIETGLMMMMAAAIGLITAQVVTTHSVREILDYRSD